MRDLSKEQICRILTAARAKRERDRLMIVCSWYHGLRVSELLQLTASSITSTHIKIDSLKGSEDAVQELIAHQDPLLSEAPELFDYARRFRPNQRIFDLTRQRVWQLMKEYAAAANVPAHRAFPHALRHSCAMQMVDKVPINVVQKRMRHKSLSSTGEYLKATEEQANAASKKVFG